MGVSSRGDVEYRARAPESKSELANAPKVTRKVGARDHPAQSHMDY